MLSKYIAITTVRAILISSSNHDIRGCIPAQPCFMKIITLEICVK